MRGGFSAYAERRGFATASGDEVAASRPASQNEVLRRLKKSGNSVDNENCDFRNLLPCEIKRVKDRYISPLRNRHDRSPRL